MRQFIVFSLVAALLTWIVPLGAFIEAAQERQICNGRRAVCLCSDYLKKKSSQEDVIQIKRQGRSAERDLSFPSFGTNFVLSKSLTFNFIGPEMTFRAATFPLPQYPAILPDEPVPIA